MDLTVKKINHILHVVVLLNVFIVMEASAQRNWEDMSGAMFEDGRLKWTTHNFGRTCGSPMWDTFYWPVNTHHYKSQHAILGSFVFAVEDNVINSHSNYSDHENAHDWMPTEGSLGYYHASQQPDNFMINGIYPRMAISKIPESWPKRSSSNPSIADVNGDHWWPGRMTPESKESDRWNKSVPFMASDVEAFCVFSDHDNIGKQSLGIEVQQQIYTYTRDYASDIAFLEYLAINTSNKDITDAYVGYYLYPYAPGGGHPRDDYLVAYDTDYDTDDIPDVIYCYDPVDEGMFEADEHSDWPNHYFGLMVLETPLTSFIGEGEIDEMGVTDFHFFPALGPNTDEAQWPVVSSDTTDPDMDASVSYYFHDTGPDNRIDNTDWIPNNAPEGDEWAYYVMTGPINLAAGDSVWYTIGFTAGVGEEQFKKNVKQAQLLAKSGYMGPGPPPPPTLTAVAGDGEITLYWDDSAEHAADPFSKVKDFEGYKLYRLAKGPFGTDDWGREITNSNGEVVGYVPLAQFDLKDGIFGIDPLNPFQNLGKDTGLQHSFIDTTVVNGVPYTYCITVYDKGSTVDDLQSFESGRSTAGDSRFVASATPGTKAIDLVPGHVVGDKLLFDPGDTTFYATVDVISPNAVTGHDYEITFEDFTEIRGVMVYQQGFNLYDLNQNEYVIENGILTDTLRGGDNTPWADGLRLNFSGRSSGVEETGWLYSSTTADGDNVPFWFAKRFLTDLDIEVTIDLSNPVTVPAFTNYGDITFQIPIRVKNLSTGEDLSPFLKFADEAWKHPDDENFNSVSYPAGTWDLEPGGACWNPILDSLLDVQNFDRAIESSDRIYGYDADGRVLFKLYTSHPPDGVSPSDGDKFYFGLQKPFPRDSHTQFSTAQSKTDQTKVTSGALEAIRVVPNPYIVSAAWDIYNRMGKIMFTNLPENCSIKIFTVAGDLIKTIEHQGVRLPSETPGSGHAFNYTRAGQGYEEWDLTTDNQLGIAYGLYVYVVTTPNGAEKTGKFAIIK